MARFARIVRKKMRLYTKYVTWMSVPKIWTKEWKWQYRLGEMIHNIQWKLLAYQAKIWISCFLSYEKEKDEF